jgi:hypothetical protein
MTNAAKSYTLINDQTGEAIETISADDFALRLAAPDLRDALLDIKRVAGKSGDHEADPWALLDLIRDRALAALARMPKR